jgi:hypothetical protein
MSWKNTLGQFIGIFVGVSLGAMAVNMVLGGRRREQPPPADYFNQSVGQRQVGIFDQAVANVQARPAQ